MISWRDGCTMLEEPLHEDGLVLELHGEVDIASSGELRTRLRNAAEAGATRILVDLGDVTFIDSIAMAAIVGAQRRLPPGGRLALFAHHPYVLLVLEAVGLQHVVHVFSTRAEAEAHLGA
jgi:anti-sigma B factor antagonist